MIQKIKAEIKLSILLLCLCAGWFFHAQGQSTQFAKYRIGNSGCEAFFPASPGAFPADTTFEGHLTWSGTASWQNYEWGIRVNNTDPKNEIIYDMSWEEYLHWQKSRLNALAGAEATRLGAGNSPVLRWNKVVNEKEKILSGDTEFTNDAGQWVKMKVWSDGTLWAVLFIRGKSPYPSPSVTDTFLWGFRFP